MREAYAVWYANLGLWLKLLAVPVALIVGFSILGRQLLLTPGGEIAPAPSAGPVGTIMFFAAVIYLSQIPLATAWHRLILTADDGTSHRYRIGGPEGRYLLKMLVIALIVIVISLMIGLMLSFLIVPALMSVTTGARGVPNPFLFWLVGTVVAVGIYGLLGYFLGYLLLMLPAAAIGRNMAGSEAAASIGNNQWRLMGVYIVTLLPLVVLEYLLGWLLGGLALKSGLVLAIVQYGPTLLFAPVVIGVLSIIYRELVQEPDAARTPSA